MNLFPDQQVTAREARECAERELGMRRSVYPRRVAEKKMSQEKADHETRAMEAIVRHFAAMPDTSPIG